MVAKNVHSKWAHHAPFTGIIPWLCQMWFYARDKLVAPPWWTYQRAVAITKHIGQCVAAAQTADVDYAEWDPNRSGLNEIRHISDKYAYPIAAPSIYALIAHYISRNSRTSVFRALRTSITSNARCEHKIKDLWKLAVRSVKHLAVAKVQLNACARHTLTARDSRLVRLTTIIICYIPIN